MTFIDALIIPEPTYDPRDTHQEKLGPPLIILMYMYGYNYVIFDMHVLPPYRHKLMKWWAQSFLVGIPRIICGFRDDEGIVRSMQTFRTSEIPRETQVGRGVLQGDLRVKGTVGEIKICPFFFTIIFIFCVSKKTHCPCKCIHF